MPSTSSPFGFQLYQSGSASAPLERMLIPSSDGTVYGKGDVVLAANSFGSIGGGPVVQACTIITGASDVPHGVIEGFEHEFVTSGMNLTQNHRPASTAMYAMVRRCMPTDIYRCQADAALTTTSHANYSITGNGGGTSITAASTTTGMSTLMLDASTAQTTSTLQMRMIGPDPRPNNALTDAFPYVLVQFNVSDIPGGAGTTGA